MPTISIIINNLNTGENKIVVHKYSLLNQLKKPEQTIFDLLKNDLQNTKMLDTGVGGGRRTVHLADLAQEYVGIDYSPAMITICKKRFNNKKYSFKTADVRSLSDFKDTYFDLVLFSFNGLDSTNHEDRTVTLKKLNEF